MGWTVRGSNPWGERDFPNSSRPILGPTQLPVQWVPVLFPGDKAAGTWRCPPPPPSNAEVKERLDLSYLYSASGPSWPVLGWPLPLPQLLIKFFVYFKGAPIVVSVTFILLSVTYFQGLYSLSNFHEIVCSSLRRVVLQAWVSWKSAQWHNLLNGLNKFAPIPSTSLGQFVWISVQKIFT